MVEVLGSCVAAPGIAAATIAAGAHSPLSALPLETTLDDWRVVGDAEKPATDTPAL